MEPTYIALSIALIGNLICWSIMRRCSMPSERIMFLTFGCIMLVAMIFIGLAEATVEGMARVAIWIDSTEAGNWLDRLDGKDKRA